MAKELGPDDPVPCGLTLSIWKSVESIEAAIKTLRPSVEALQYAYERAQQTSAAGFRAHTKTSAARFHPPHPHAAGAPCTDICYGQAYPLGIASHGCHVPDEEASRIDACGE